MSNGKKTVALVTALILAIGIGLVTLTKRSAASGNILFSWTRSLPITYENPSIGTFGGTELRAIAVLGGKLYAANDYWQDSQLDNPALPGPQIYRLDSPGAQWQVEYESQDCRRAVWLAGISGVFELGESLLYQRQERQHGSPAAELLVAGAFSRGTEIDVFLRSPSGRWS